MREWLQVVVLLAAAALILGIVDWLTGMPVPQLSG
jgi:preprotein translocase subunit SecE